MRVLLESQELWTIVEEGYSDLPTNASESDQNIEREKIKKDREALHIMFQAVSETIFERVATCKTSKEAWEILHKAYRGENRVKTVRLQTLRCEFDALKMKDSESIEDYINRTTVIVNQLRLNEERIEEQRIVEKFLRSLTRKYESVVVAIEESKDLNAISTEELQGILQSHELRLKQYDDAPTKRLFKYKAINMTDQDSQDQKTVAEDGAREEESSTVQYDVSIVKNWDMWHASAIREVKMINLIQHSYTLMKQKTGMMRLCS
ncbi:uncharacterized protein LOC110913590 [Helianthus annuus]|uniref:uncharacterized protein LOC110913590 n=1 Tax=Helianthus annuus TaxID=4232 RepID=UPI000B8FC800|nr:uncharacterized protein LOC110913590 [Helianthus annuus]